GSTPRIVRGFEPWWPGFPLK
ncbi:hypothetical protein CP8484711_0917, partial [Chlamydia psittaci 84-8471/1]